MTIFDLFFVLTFLGTVIGAVTALVLLARRKSGRAGVWLRRVVMVDGIYAAAIMATSLVTPRHVVALGEAQCFDDWCITVTGSRRAPGGSSDSIEVNIVLSSLARGIAQGERDVAVRLVDSAGAGYRPAMRDADIPLSVTLPPSGSQVLSRLFVVPSATRGLKVLVVHDWFPHCCIIGDRESVLHKSAVVRLRDADTAPTSAAGARQATFAARR